MLRRRTFIAQGVATLASAPTWPHVATGVAAQGEATPTAANSVHVLHAGSLTQLIQQGLAPAILEAEDLAVTDTAGNSVKVANSIKDGSLVGDVFMSAGADVNQALIGEQNGDWVSWFLVFASNEVVVAYSPQSAFADQVKQARSGDIPWYQVLAEPGVKFGRDDPNLDPLGYYGVFVGQLGEGFYKEPGWQERIFGADNNPLQVISPDFPQLESGELDAIFAYRTGAEAAGVPYITLPDELNLSNPDFDELYASASYTTDKGQVFQGSTIRYTVAPLRDGNAETALQFVEFLISEEGKRITEEAFFLPHPIWVGGEQDALPEALQSQVEGTYEFP